MTEEKKLIKELIIIFDIKDIDFLGYPITKDNPLQYHHIVFKQNGGKTTLDNGSLLTAKAHSLFHKIVNNQYITSKKITREFKKLNESKMPPTKEYYENIKNFLEEFQIKEIRKSKLTRNRVK